MNTRRRPSPREKGCEVSSHRRRIGMGGAESLFSGRWGALKRVCAPGRRQLLRAGVAATGSLLLPGRAPAQGGAKPLSGTTLNIACWSSPYAKLLTDYVPQFEEATGAKVNYETPSFPIYNQRIDVELSTGGSSYDVLNVTFIYIGRWIGAGWFVPLDPYLEGPAEDAGGLATRRFPAGRDCGIQGCIRQALCDPVDRRHLYGRGRALRFVREDRQTDARHLRRGGGRDEGGSYEGRDPRLSAREPLRLELYSLVAGLRRQRVPRSARGFDAGARHAGGDRRGRFFCQVAA